MKTRILEANLEQIECKTVGHESAVETLKVIILTGMIITATSGTRRGVYPLQNVLTSALIFIITENSCQSLVAV